MHCRALRSGAPTLRGVASRMSCRARHRMSRGTRGKRPPQAGMRVAATGISPAAGLVPAGPPQRKCVAIALLLQGLFDGKAHREFHRRKLRLGLRRRLQRRERHGEVGAVQFIIHDKRSRSRERLRAASFLPMPPRLKCEGEVRDGKEGVVPIFAGPLRLASPELKQKRKRIWNADRRVSYRLHRRMQRALIAARSPVGVPPRLSPRGVVVPKAQRQAMFPGTWRTRDPEKSPSGGRSNAVCAGVTHPNLSQPREASPTPVIVPGDMMPELPGRGLQLRPRAPPSPPCCDMPPQQVL